MITLPNGCSCTDIKVSPQNWNGKGASTKKNWRVYYRFKDPLFPDVKMIELKLGLNLIKDLAERRHTVKQIIEKELFKLQHQGYNPITNSYVIPIEIDYEIDPETPFIKALWEVKDKLDCGHETLVDMKAALKVMEKASAQIRLNLLLINRVSIRHLMMLMDRCAIVNPRWSARRHNMYRSYLIMMFKKLTKLEATQGNPALNLDLAKPIKKLKVILNSEQRKRISDYLKENHYRYWCFVNLFFHSGGRMPELMQQKVSTVDLENQKYRCIVKKRKVWTEVERTIKDVALPYWREFLKDCTGNEFLFGVDFVPSNEKAMSVDTPGRTWLRIVKKGMGINVDFYSLKHLHTDEMTANLSIKDAAKHNEHDEQTALSFYAVGEAERRHQRIKKVGNEF